MPKPRKKKMGRPLEDVPLRVLLKSVRRDIEITLEEKGASPLPHKPKKNKE